MKITGYREIDHPRSDVFVEGLNSTYWRYDDEGLLINPVADVIKKGGKVEIEIERPDGIPFIDKIFTSERIGFTAIVSQCVKNKLVVVEGKASKLIGNVALMIALQDSEYTGATSAQYTLGVSLGFAGRLLEGNLRPHLSSQIEPFADRLADGVGVALDAREPFGERLAS